MVEQLCKPNVYQLKSVSGVGPDWIVNFRQLQDLHKAHNDSDNSSVEEWALYPPTILKLN